MTDTNAQTIGVIGLGLIGGSLARAIKKYTPMRVLAYDADFPTADRALQLKVADEVADKIDARFSACDIVFLCAPASLNLFNLRIVAPHLKPDAILSDVSGVKTPIHNLAKELGLSDRFVGGHPMAGSEKSGFQNARASLFKDACFFLTATSDTPLARVETLQTLIEQLQAKPYVITPKEHDRLTAAISHLPHVAAAALVNTVRDADTTNDTMRMIAAGGFKDITRIAASSPDLWRQICTLNKEALSSAIGQYIKKLDDARALIDRADAEAIAKFFSDARDYRATFEDKKGTE